MEIAYDIPEGVRLESGEINERISYNGSWSDLGRALYNAKCEVDDCDEDRVVLSFEPEREQAVRSAVQAAREGSFGPEVQAFWTSASETQ